MRAVGNDRRAAIAYLEECLDSDRTPAYAKPGLAIHAARIRRDLEYLEEGNEDGTNRDVRPFDDDPRTDEEIKQAVYDAADREEWEE